jgi:4-amino-4-deoxy-L-arabinose transferase-like glycosyltransferase
MATGTRTFGLDETLIEPRVLEPPPTRHALLICLLVLAAIVHFGTAGWSPIHNGPEGYYAAAAREMVRTNSWMPPSRDGSATRRPPLVYWLAAASFKAFGVTPTAARMPVALAMVIGIGLTFLIGERLANYWRGFIAGLVHLSWLGSFVWGRMLSAEPMFAACIAGAIFCGVCGYQRAQTRRLWFAGTWACIALACLTKGVYGVIYPAVIFLALALSFREARLRFRVLLDWRFIAGFIILLAAASYWLRFDLVPALSDDTDAASGLPLTAFLLRTVACWMPALLLIIPGVLFAARKIFRPHEFEFADALPLYWAAVGFLPFVIFAARQDYHTMAMWPALALCVAWAWDRMPGPLRLAGIGLVAIVGFSIVLVPQSSSVFGLSMHTLGPMPMLMGAALVFVCAVAAYLTVKHHELLAVASILLVIAAVGLSVAEATARLAPFFSFESAASFLRPALDEKSEVLFEGSPQSGSSLNFYLTRAPRIIDERQPNAADSVLDAMAAPEVVALVVHKSRIPFWQERLTDRFHIYHQAATCGAYVVINNHP